MDNQQPQQPQQQPQQPQQQPQQQSQQQQPQQYQQQQYQQQQYQQQQYQGPSAASKFMNFDEPVLTTPKNIKMVYIIGMAAMAVYCLMQIIIAIAWMDIGTSGMGFAQLMMGLITMGLSPFLPKVICEGLVAKNKK